MTKSLRTRCLCVSLSVFLGLLGFVTTRAVAGVACPCDFNTIPKDAACWLSSTDPSQPFFGTQVVIPPQPDTTCSLEQIAEPPVTQFFVGKSTVDLLCTANTDQPTTCPPIAPRVLTLAEFEACLCDLQAYATALNQVDGIDVDGAPYICSDEIECALPIPTLNQWGMIIMAGVLGLFAVIALFVMRTGRTVAGVSGPDGAPQ